MAATSRKKKKNAGFFGAEAKASAKQVVRARTIKEKGTNEHGRIIGAGPKGWLKVQWENRAKPTLIKRSELKLARGLRSLKNPIEIKRCSSCGQVFGQTTECPMCRAGVGRQARRNPYPTLKRSYMTLPEDSAEARRLMADAKTLKDSKTGAGQYVFLQTIKALQAMEDKALKALKRNPKPSRARVIAATKGALRGAGSVRGMLSTRKTGSPASTQRETKLKARLKRARTPIVGPKGKLPNPLSSGTRADRIWDQIHRIFLQLDKTGNKEKRAQLQVRLRAQLQKLGGDGATIGKLVKDFMEKHRPEGKLNPAKGSRDALGVWHPNPARVSERELLAYVRRYGSLDVRDFPHIDLVDRAMRRLEKRGLVAGAGRYSYLAVEKKKRKNPSVTAIAEKFQGEANGALETLHAANGCPSNVARAGKLVFLKVAGRTFRIPGAVVCIAPNEKLWIVGDHAPLLAPKAKSGEGLDVGEVTHICYETAKRHVGGGKTYEYVHEFGEDGGKRPHLIIDHEGMPILRGGDYKIKAEGIVN